MALSISWNKHKDSSDADLVNKFRDSGDLEVLGLLYERYMYLVYGVALKYLQNRDDAKDAVTSIFEKLIIEVPKHDIDNFKSWLHVLTKNFCLMKLRADKSSSLRHENWQNEQIIFVESHEEMHPLDEEDAVLNKLLQECINELKDQQQECIKLFYFENKSYREISSSLKLEEKKVKSFIQNGKRNLKICIEKKDGKKS